MNDIFQTKILCNKCNKETKEISLNENGFKIRAKECPKCGKTFPHPGDMKDYEHFKQLKQREFDVKLRRVGNSHSITIPREILDFEKHFDQMQKEMDKMMRLSLDKPGKIILRFRRIK
jgi:tRNA(Ile2) C34 agmatinyltransferase TiaS